MLGTKPAIGRIAGPPMRRKPTGQAVGQAAADDVAGTGQQQRKQHQREKGRGEGFACLSGYLHVTLPEIRPSLNVIHAD
jgi:hypothetical protein